MKGIAKLTLALPMPVLPNGTTPYAKRVKISGDEPLQQVSVSYTRGALTAVISECHLDRRCHQTTDGDLCPHQWQLCWPPQTVGL